MHRKGSAPFVLFVLMHGLTSLATIKTVSAADSPCSFNQAKRAADCTQLGLHSVPRNLPGNTEILDLSSNEITALVNTSFNVSITLENSGETQCSYEGSFKTAAGEPLIDFDPVKECGPQFVLYISVAASLVCATLALILIYYNRWKIRYGLFLCKIHFIGYREIIPQQQREDYQYDMCVIIYDEDEEWANDVFRRGLEESLPEYGRVAIGDEALRLEMYYLDSVSRLVETSFKVIFLISADALKNHMFLLKFRLALDHVNEVQMEKIVLVFLEDIPDANLPFLIRLFLSDNRAYLMWPQDPEGQACFWDKLAKYMTVNRYCNPLVPP
ncbi:toll-like receptor 4 [Diadema antillarum]|uniref:toll-like receptor 4 n=1 Tax=Diadema antillarum TaxID=105358 RepID=UPI003A891B1C